MFGRHFRLPCRHFTQISRRRSGTGLVTPVFIRAEDFRWRTAILDQNGRHTYGQILDSSSKLSQKLIEKYDCFHNVDKITGPRIAFLCPNDVSYVIAKWTTWMLGGIAVPLSPSHPQSEIQYFLKDSQANLVISTPEFSEKISDVSKKLDVEHLEIDKDDFLCDHVDESPVRFGGRKAKVKVKGRNEELLASNLYRKQSALIIYTSGTTGRPKGVVHTHGSLYASTDMMRTAWGWSQSDSLLHVLPLHHIHGIVNCLMTPLSVGATCVMMPKFDQEKVWSSLLHPIKADSMSRVNGETQANEDSTRVNHEPLTRVNKNPLTRVNVFMAVPTIYAKLLQFMRDKHGQFTADFIKSTCMSKIRLMVSGSAALPEPVLRDWETLTGHRLLERYGMTETGMVLTNPLNGERQPGSVGRPFPGVEVRIGKTNVYSDTGYDVISTGNSRSTSVTPGVLEEAGELLVRSPSMFREYWRKPDATRETFTEDGWFKTGDTATHEDDVYKILGRTSVDIIKSGGYKISALDIERHLLDHPDIQAVLVVGLPDMTWGQKIAAVTVLQPGTQLSCAGLREWCRDRMPPYQIPTVLKVIDSMPYNAMGKVNKKEVIKLYFEKEMKNVI